VTLEWFSNYNCVCSVGKLLSFRALTCNISSIFSMNSVLREYCSLLGIVIIIVDFNVFPRAS